MKIIKKILTFLLTFILTGLISLLIISFTLKDVILNDILYESFKTTIIGKNYKEGNITLDDIITEDGVITDNDFVNEILESKEIKDMVNRYLDKIINTMADENIPLNELNEYDLEQDMINYIKENKEILSQKTGIEITDEMINKASEKLDERDTKKVIKQTVENTRRNLSPEEKLLLKMYNFITSTNLKIILVISIIIVLLLIAVIKKSVFKWIKNLSQSMTIAGTLTILISMALEIIISKILKVQENIKLESMSNLSIIILIIGIILYIVYKIIDRLLIKEKKNEVSKVSE